MAVTSPIAFEPLINKSILHAAFNVARAFSIQTGISTHLAIATSDPNRMSEFDCEILDCDPQNPWEFARAIKSSAPCDLVAIHDSQRPLTRTTQFHRTIEALIGGLDAVRPASAFTETLKAISEDGNILHTVDRSSMLRISTPEVIRFSAIDFDATTSTWFLPLKFDAQCATVDADPESLRVNSIEEISLLESFVHWQQNVATH